MEGGVGQVGEWRTIPRTPPGLEGVAPCLRVILSKVGCILTSIGRKWGAIAGGCWKTLCGL